MGYAIDRRRLFLIVTLLLLAIPAVLLGSAVLITGESPSALLSRLFPDDLDGWPEVVWEAPEVTIEDVDDAMGTLRGLNESGRVPFEAVVAETIRDLIAKLLGLLKNCQGGQVQACSVFTETIAELRQIIDSMAADGILSEDAAEIFEAELILVEGVYFAAQQTAILNDPARAAEHEQAQVKLGEIRTIAQREASKLAEYYAESEATLEELRVQAELFSILGY